MSKHSFDTPPTQVYQELKIVMQSMASTVDQLQPFDFEALIRKVLTYHQEIGSFNRAFYSVVDMQIGDFSWQYGLSTALGAPPKDFSLVEFLARLHPDYLPMFRFWAMVINEAAYSMALGEGVYDYVYHIALPLQRDDHSYHWYTQHSFAMQSDAAGHYVNHFNFYDYGGQWHAHNRAPFLPFVTNYNQPSPDLNIRMYDLATPRIRAFSHKQSNYLWNGTGGNAFLQSRHIRAGSRSGWRFDQQPGNLLVHVRLVYFHGAPGSCHRLPIRCLRHRHASVCRGWWLFYDAETTFQRNPYHTLTLCYLGEFCARRDV